MKKSLTSVFFLILLSNLIMAFMKSKSFLMIMILSEMFALNFLVLFLLSSCLYDFTFILFFFVFVAAETVSALVLLILFSYTKKFHQKLISSSWVGV